MNDTMQAKLSELWAKSVEAAEKLMWAERDFRKLREEYHRAVEKDYPLSAPQIAAAARLAGAYGHEWASGRRWHAASSPATLSDIRAVTVLVRCEGEEPGIEAPAFKDYPGGTAEEFKPVVAHQEANGVSWEVDQDGTSTVWLQDLVDSSRRVFGVMANPAGELSVKLGLVPLFGSQIIALSVALGALVGAEEVGPFLLSLPRADREGWANEFVVSSETSVRAMLQLGAAVTGVKATQWAVPQEVGTPIFGGIPAKFEALGVSFDEIREMRICEMQDLVAAGIVDAKRGDEKIKVVLAVWADGAVKHMRLAGDEPNYPELIRLLSR